MRDNWRGYSKQLYDFQMDHLEHALTTPGEKFHILQHNGKVIAFFRLIPDPETGGSYFGTFNTRREATGLGFGKPFCEAAIMEAAKSGPVTLFCHPKTPMIKFYEELGFKVVDTLYDFHGTREIIHRMLLPGAS